MVAASAMRGGRERIARNVQEVIMVIPVRQFVALCALRARTMVDRSTRSDIPGLCQQGMFRSLDRRT